MSSPIRIDEQRELKTLAVELDNTPKKSFRTIDLHPHHGEIIKPAETIDIIGTAALTLQDRRIWNTLIDNAFGPELAEERHEFKIPISVLRPGHNSNERIEDSIERLMSTVVRLKTPKGMRRFQLLGGNDMGEETRNHGYLRYSFDYRLAELLKESTLFGKLEKAVIWSFQSKYALALYEYMSRLVRLKRKWNQEITVDELRDVLGVPEGKLRTFGSLKQKALDPALEELNALAPFEVKAGTTRTGRKISQVVFTWIWKDHAGKEAARAEVERPKIGRKARIRGKVESVYDLDAAVEELAASIPTGRI